MKALVKVDPRFPLGTVAEWKGQEYRLVAHQGHVWPDGRPDILLAWETDCLNCGEPFEQMTAQRKLRDPARRCPACTRKRKGLPILN